MPQTSINLAISLTPFALTKIARGLEVDVRSYDIDMHDASAPPLPNYLLLTTITLQLPSQPQARELALHIIDSNEARAVETAAAARAAILKETPQ